MRPRDKIVTGGRLGFFRTEAGEARIHAETATLEVRASEIAKPRSDDHDRVGCQTCRILDQGHGRV